MPYLTQKGGRQQETSLLSHTSPGPVVLQPHHCPTPHGQALLVSPQLSSWALDVLCLPLVLQGLAPQILASTCHGPLQTANILLWIVYLSKANGSAEGFQWAWKARRHPHASQSRCQLWHDVWKMNTGSPTKTMASGTTEWLTQSKVTRREHAAGFWGVASAPVARDTAAAAALLPTCGLSVQVVQECRCIPCTWTSTQ
jgi:hypothetical protein